MSCETAKNGGCADESTPRTHVVDAKVLVFQPVGLDIVVVQLIHLHRGLIDSFVACFLIDTWNRIWFRSKWRGSLYWLTSLTLRKDVPQVCLRLAKVYAVVILRHGSIAITVQQANESYGAVPS